MEWKLKCGWNKNNYKTRDEEKKNSTHSSKWQYCMNMETHHDRTNRNTKKNYMRIAFLASWILLACLATEWYTRNSLALTAPTIATATHKKKTHTERFKPRAVFGFWVFRFMFNLLRVVFFSLLFYSSHNWMLVLLLLCTRIVASAKRLECCCCVELFDDKWRTEKTPKKWLPCMHHLHVSVSVC